MAGGKKAPLNDPKVDVRAQPDWDNDPDPNWDYLDKVSESVEQEVRRALDENQDDGAGAQIGAAHDVVDDASDKVDPNRVKEIYVDIEDEDGRRTKIHRETSGKNR